MRFLTVDDVQTEEPALGITESVRSQSRTQVSNVTWSVFDLMSDLGPHRTYFLKNAKKLHQPSTHLENPKFL